MSELIDSPVNLEHVADFIADLFDVAAFEKTLQECEIADEDVPTLSTRLEDLLGLAKEKINVFPYSSVKQCWFNLYTDASILRCKRLLSKANECIEASAPDEADEALSEAVAAIDYALIVAGGGDEQRQQFIQDVFEYLDIHLHRGVNETPSKRRKLNDERTKTGSEDRARLLSTALGPVPRIQRPVERLKKPSLEKFQDWATKTCKPLVIENILQHWPALIKWKSSDYWLRTTLAGRRLVPVEIGQSYHDEDWRQEIMPYRDFLEKYIPLDDAEAEGETGYLAQHDLFRQMKKLEADVTVPDYCYADLDTIPATDTEHDSKNEEPDITSNTDQLPDVHKNIWFGGRTVSPLHHDPYHNILCQVHGTKYVRLYSPEHTSKLYPRSKTESAPHLRSKATGETEKVGKQESTQQDTIDMSNNSTVDIYAMQVSPDEDWDEKWPGISEVPYLECLLEAGQALYIPKGWWHYIRSLSATGISVSFWW